MCGWPSGCRAPRSRRRSIAPAPGEAFELRIATRWPDFDALGHLSHAIYHVDLDEARDEALRRTVAGSVAGKPATPGAEIGGGDFDAWPNVVVHASIDYEREIRVGRRSRPVSAEEREALLRRPASR